MHTRPDQRHRLQSKTAALLADPTTPLPCVDLVMESLSQPCFHAGLSNTRAAGLICKATVPTDNGHWLVAMSLDLRGPLLSITAPDHAQSPCPPLTKVLT